jgi:hypothetical protein
MKELEKLINKASSFEQEDPSSITDKGTNFCLRPYFQIANGVTLACYSIRSECSFLGVQEAGARS